MNKYLRDFTFVCKYYSFPEYWYTLTNFDDNDRDQCILYRRGSRSFAIAWYYNSRDILASTSGSNLLFRPTLLKVLETVLGKAYEQDK